MKKIIGAILIAVVAIYSETLFEIKDAANNPVLNISTDGLRVMNLGDTLMVISSDAIRANIGVTNKGLSRSFSVTTASSKGKGLFNALEIDAGSASMTSQEGKYTDFSPSNIFIGLNSGRINSTGHDNVFIGNQSGVNNSSGYSNIFIGMQSGLGNSTGRSNIFIGDESGKSSTTGMREFVHRSQLPE
jgi:trimeric autotransporter adhesin